MFTYTFLFWRRKKGEISRRLGIKLKKSFVPMNQKKEKREEVLQVNEKLVLQKLTDLLAQERLISDDEKIKIRDLIQKGGEL